MPDSQTSQNQLANDNLSLHQQASEMPNDLPMLAQVEQGMVLQLADGIIQACNHTAERILGMTTERLIGWNLLDPTWGAICEDGSPFPGDTHPAKAALRTGQPCLNIVIGLYKPSGELVWLLLSSQPLFQMGGTTPYAVVTTFSDITALKRGQFEINSSLEKEDSEKLRRGDAKTENFPVFQLSGGDRSSSLKSELQEIQRLIQQIADAIPGLLYLYDLVEQRNVYINLQVAEILGYTQDQIQTMGLQSLFLLLHPDDLARYPAHLERLNSAADGEVTTFEYQYRHANGEWRYFYSYETVFTRTADGSPQQILGIAQDITERRRTEDALRQSEERIRLASTAAELGMWFWNLTTNELVWTETCKTLFGLSPDTEVSYELFLDLLHPQDKHRTHEAVTRTLEEKVDYDIEFRSLWADGSVHWIAAKGRCFYDRSGKPVRMMGTVQDITQRKHTELALHHSEQRYRLLAEAIPEIVFSTDAEGRADYVNQRWQEYTGLPLEETVGYGWLKALHPHDVVTIKQPWQQALQLGILYENDHRFQRASDGTYRWHLVRGYPLKDDQGRVIKWFGTCTDIHAQKQLEEERKLMLERETAARNAAEDANRIKDQFLAILSHELRSPLNPILGWTKLLKSRKFDEVVTARALDTIDRNAKLQIQLIDDLLDVSRILRSKLSLNVATVDLAVVIDAALETVRLAAEAKSIDLRFSILDGHGEASALGGVPLLDLASGENQESTNSQSKNQKPKLRSIASIAQQPKIPNPKFLVAGDAYRLQQVVGNLLNNAVKFTTTGGCVEVRLSIFSESNSDSALIQVIDTGSGISPDFLPHVFEYFRQADSSTTRKFGGLGLGLAIVSHLVELHGGTVTADSPGVSKGATFTVRLPLMKTPSELNQDNSRAFACPNLQGLKILIVDDDADTQELLRFLLEQYGAQATVATSATEAYAALSQSKMDLLLSDLGMPETDGYDLIRQIRAMPPELGGDILAIALTAYAHQTDQERVFAAGFQKHVAKPVEPEKLLASIADLIGQNSGC